MVDLSLYFHLIDLSGAHWSIQLCQLPLLLPQSSLQAMHLLFQGGHEMITVRWSHHRCGGRPSLIARWFCQWSGCISGLKYTQNNNMVCIDNSSGKEYVVLALRCIKTLVATPPMHWESLYWLVQTTFCDSCCIFVGWIKRSCTKSVSTCYNEWIS